MSGGTLRLGTGTALPTGKALIVNGTTANGSATFDLNGNDFAVSTLTLGGSSASANAINTVSTGANTLTLGGDVSYVYASAPANDPGAAVISGKLNLGSATRTFTVNDSIHTDSDLTISADISSGANSGLTKSGSGRLILSGTNTYTGNTIISAGFIRIGSAANLPSTTNVQLNGGVLELAYNRVLTYGTGAGQVQWTGSGGFSAYGGDLTLDYQGGADLTWGTNFVSNTITNSLILSSASSDSMVTLPNNIAFGSNNRTINVTNGVDSLIDATLSGGLSGTGGLTKSGAGVLRLTGTNTYTGNTTIGSSTTNGGTIIFGTPNALYNANQANWIATKLVVNSGASAAFNVGGVGEFTAADIDTLKVLGTSSGGFRNGSYLGLDTTNAVGGNFTYASVIANTRSGLNVIGLDKRGSGTLTLSGANTYTGATYVWDGTLSATNDSSLGTVDDSTYVFNGGTLDLNNVNIGAESITMTPFGSTGLTANPKITGTGDSSLAGDITLYTKAEVGGTGSLLLTGAIANTAEGLSLTKTDDNTVTFGGSTDNHATGVIVNAGTLILAKDSTANVHAVGFDGLTINNGGTVQLAGTGDDQIEGEAVVEVKSGGTLDLNGRNEGFPTLQGSGTVTNTAAATTSTLKLGENDADSNFSGTLQDGDGVLALLKDGGGKVTLSGSSSYTGITEINNGILAITNALALGTNAGMVNVYDSGTLELDNVALGNKPFFAGGPGYLGNGNILSVGSSSMAGDVLLGTITRIGGSGSLLMTGNVNNNEIEKIGTGTLTLGGTTNNTNLEAEVKAGVLVLAKDSSEDVHAINGGLYIDDGGTAQLGGTGGDQILTTGQVVVDGTGVFDLNGRSEGISNLVGSGHVTNTAATTTSTFTVGENDADGSFSGQLQDGAGVLALTKTGGGTLTLTGANTYTGVTTINNGKLQIGDGGTAGSITGNVTLVGGGALLFNRSDDVTYGGNVSGVGSVMKFGTGTLTLSGANSHTGDTWIYEGTISVTNGAALGANDPDGVVYIEDGTTLNLNNVNAGGSNRAIYVYGSGVDGKGAITSTGTSSLAGDFLGGDNIAIGGEGSLTLTGVISSTVTKVGSGTLTFAGTQANAASAVVQEGKVVLAKDSSDDVSAIGYGLTVGSGTIAQLAGTGGNQIAYGAIVDVQSGATLDFNGRNESISTLTGEGTVTNTAASTTSIITLGENDEDSDFSGTLQDGAGALALEKTGSGTLTLTGANTYSGGTVVNVGTVAAGHNTAVGTGTVKVNNGTFLVKNGFTVANAVVLSGGSYNRELGAGSNLTNAIDSTSNLDGGRSTAAKLLGGVTSSDATVQSSFSAFSEAGNDEIRQSDIYELSGIPVLDPETGMTDTFVLQLSLPSATPDSILAWLDPETNLWANAVEGNFGGTLTFVLGAYNPEDDFHLGYYGVDPTTGAVWAVLNHNSSFTVTSTAVVPEPQTWLLGIVGISLLFIYRRRILSRP